jgi:hypothetical protein
MAFGCVTTSPPQCDLYVLGTPHHLEDWQRLESVLEAEHIQIPGAESHLGVSQFFVPRENAARARRIVEKVIRDGSRSVGAESGGR